MRGIATIPVPSNVNRSSIFLGPPTRAPSSAAPVLALTGAPFRVVPLPTVARNNSSVIGTNSATATGRLSTTRAAATDQSCRPAMKGRVPSIGSTTQTRRAFSRAGSFSLSSDSQPSPGSIKCWRSRSFEAMSASVTGESPCPLVHCFNGPPKNFLATAPACVTAAANRSRSRENSDTGNGQTLKPQGRRVDAKAKLQIVGWRYCFENIGQIAGDGDLTHRIGALPLLDPEAG